MPSTTWRVLRAILLGGIIEDTRDCSGCCYLTSNAGGDGEGINATSLRRLGADNYCYATLDLHNRSATDTIYRYLLKSMPLAASRVRRATKQPRPSRTSCCRSSKRRAGSRIGAAADRQGVRWLVGSWPVADDATTLAPPGVSTSSGSMHFAAVADHHRSVTRRASVRPLLSK